MHMSWQQCAQVQKGRAARNRGLANMYELHASDDTTAACLGSVLGSSPRRNGSSTQAGGLANLYEVLASIPNGSNNKQEG